jgi:UDP-N-acetylglucosamine acyltransferase
MPEQTVIHPTAVIEAGAQIGPGCHIGPYAFVGGQVSLGSDNVLGPHVVIEGRTRIGARNRFVQFCSIGAGPQTAGWTGAVSGLSIGDDNVLREFVTIHAASEDADAPTRLGSGNLLMVNAHVAHDCQVGDGVTLANGATLGGHVQVGDGAVVSGLAAVHQGVRVGTLAFIAGGSMVTQDVAPFCLVQGDRARLVSLNLVGLRRAGLDVAQIAALRRTYRTLFLGSGAMAERIAAVRAAEQGQPQVAALAAFLEGSGGGASRPRGPMPAAPSWRPDPGASPSAWSWAINR